MKRLSVIYKAIFKDNKIPAIEYAYPSKLDTRKDLFEAKEWISRVHKCSPDDFFLLLMSDNKKDDTIGINFDQPVHDEFDSWTTTNWWMGFDGIFQERIVPVIGKNRTIFESGINEWVGPICECGANVTYGPEQAKQVGLHSSWCPLHRGT